MKQLQEDLKVVLSEAKSRAKRKYLDTKDHLKNPSEHGEYTINYWYARTATCDTLIDLSRGHFDAAAFEAKVATLMKDAYKQLENGVSEPIRGTCDGAISTYDLARGVLADNHIELTTPEM